MHSKHWISALALTAGLVIGGFAQAQTTVRIAWYSDGNEGEVITDLLKRFEAQNKDIKVVLDQVPYKAITENLPVQLALGPAEHGRPRRALTGRRAAAGSPGSPPTGRGRPRARPAPGARRRARAAG